MHLLVNVSWRCQLACPYCVAPDTRVLTAGGRSVPIADVQVGDVLVGLTSEQMGTLRSTRLVPTTVEAKAAVYAAVYEITLADGRTLRCSGDHRWLSNRGWKYTVNERHGNAGRHHLTHNNWLRGIGPLYDTPPETEAYRRGYLSGILRGDGTVAEFNIGPTEWRSPKTGRVKRYNAHTGHCCILRLKDHEALDRAATYLEGFGIPMDRFQFTETMQGIRNQSKEGYERVTACIAWDDDREYGRGFLAGLYDAEGHTNQKAATIRISNTDHSMLERAERVLINAGFTVVWDQPKSGTNRPVYQLRVNGGTNTLLRFAQWANSAITRKRTIVGRSPRDVARIADVRALGHEDWLIDITTSTGNFVAEGFISHNCLLPHIKINRTAPEHSWSEWAVALRDHTPPGSIIDIAGGEPLLFEGLAYLLTHLAESGRHWAITTNAMSKEGTDALLRVRPGGCVLVNVSDHPGNAAAAPNIARLQAAYPVVFNRVDHPQAGQKHAKISSIIPYQSWREGTELDGIRRWCNSGLNHWVCDPGGDVFRCNPQMAQGKETMGNLFRRTVATPEPIVCESGCSTCYTSVPTAWPVEMRAVL